MTSGRKPGVEQLDIPVRDRYGNSVPGFLHLPPGYERVKGTKTAAILLSGAGGGVAGPSSMYLSIGDKLSSLEPGVPVLRLDYRYPAENKPCVADTQAAMDHLEESYSISRFVLVGWSFGGAPVFTVGGADQRVAGCATVASQTAETDGIEELPPRPVLLLHGTGDRTLSPTCSQRLYDAYGPHGDRELKLFDGDDHALTKNAVKAEELLCSFILKCAGLSVRGPERERIKQQTMSSTERTEKMKQAGDLDGETLG